MAEITFTVTEITSSVSKITFVVAEITFKAAVSQHHFYSGRDNFQIYCNHFFTGQDLFCSRLDIL